MTNLNLRYLITPNGLSFDDLVRAAIVATKPENRKSVVTDQNTGEVIPRQVLVRMVKDSTPPTPKPKELNNLSFVFESDESFPLLRKLVLRDEHAYT